VEKNVLTIQTNFRY